MAFTGTHRLRRRCAFCNEHRFMPNKDDEQVDMEDEFYDNTLDMSNLQRRAYYSYLPLIPRLRLLYSNQAYAKKMRYPKELRAEVWADGVRDVWDGEMMKTWVNE